MASITQAHDLFDLEPCGLGDRVAAVQNPRHGRWRDTRVGGNITDRDVRSPSGLAHHRGAQDKAKSAAGRPPLKTISFAIKEVS